MKMQSSLKVPTCITKCVHAIICSNSFSHRKVDQKIRETVSQSPTMYNYVYWMHLLNTRICRYTHLTLRVIYCDQDKRVMKLFNLEMDNTMFKSGVCLLSKFCEFISPAEVVLVCLKFTLSS